MHVEILHSAADPPDSQEFTVGKVFLDMVWVRRFIFHVAVGVCWLTKEGAPQLATFMVDSGIQKIGCGGADFSGEFDHGLTVIQVADEGI